jgi:hypothetical protein
MSASICWEPVPTKTRTLPVSAPQSFMDSLGIIGIDIRGGRAIATQEHITALRGMAHVAGQNGQPYVALIEAIEKHGEVKIWAEY